MTRPLLILISGAPDTGKTVLAQKLATALPTVVLEKDAIKENLFDSLGEGDREWSRKLGAATFDLLYMLVERLLMAGQSVVAEAAFTREYAARWIERMGRKYDFDVLELHCHTDLDTALRRYVERAESDERHSGHGSGISPEAIADELRGQYARYGPITDGVRLVRIDTTDFSAVDYDEIVDIARKSLGTT
jgi:predicted kinase